MTNATLAIFLSTLACRSRLKLEKAIAGVGIQSQILFMQEPNCSIMAACINLCRWLFPFLKKKNPYVK
jgi:hypothetical protein